MGGSSPPRRLRATSNSPLEEISFSHKRLGHKSGYPISRHLVLAGDEVGVAVRREGHPVTEVFPAGSSYFASTSSAVGAMGWAIPG